MSKAQINKIIKLGGALGSILDRFLPKLVKQAISLGKHIWPFRIKCSNVCYRCCNSKKIHGYRNTVKFYNEDVNDMTKTVKALVDSDVLLKGVTETFKKDIKNGGALPLIPMLLGTLGVSLLTGKGLYRTGTIKTTRIVKKLPVLKND